MAPGTYFDTLFLEGSLVCHHLFLFLHRTIKPADLNLNLNLKIETRLHKRKGFISPWKGALCAFAGLGCILLGLHHVRKKHPPPLNSAVKFECLLLTAQVCCLLWEGKCKVAPLVHPAGWKEPKAENSQPLAFLFKTKSCSR